jgi:hypothetical protein
MIRTTRLFAFLLATLSANTAAAQISIVGPPVRAGDDFVETGGSSTFFDPLANDAVFGLGTLDPLSFELLETARLGELQVWSASASGVELLYLRDPSAPYEADSVRYRICTMEAQCDEAVIWLLTGSIVPRVSANPDRSDPVDLSFASLSGEVYVFLPDLFTQGTVASVRFLLNGEPTNYDSEVPYDLVGGTASLAEPLDTTGLTDGETVVTTEIKFTDAAGGHIARFDTRTEVANRPVLAFSYSPDRSSAGLLDGGFFGGDVFVFAGIMPLNPGIGPVPFSGSAVRKVRFWLDGTRVRTDGEAPYDLAAGSGTLAEPFDMSALADGPHKLVAVIRYRDGRVERIRADFEAI